MKNNWWVIMKILLLLLLSFSLFPQEEKEDTCAQELEEKCADADGKYNCIMADPTNEKKKFSKVCFPKFKEDVEMGKYSHPCLDEMKAACPNPDNKNCVKQKKSSFSPNCQEFLSDEGMPQAPKQKELDKVTEDCKAETITTCGFHLVNHEFLIKDGKTKEADKKLKEYISCTKGVFKKPKDPKCQDSLNEYIESNKKEPPSKGEGFQEIK